MTLDSNEIVISEADNDGTTEWGGQTLDEEFAQNHDGVSYDSTDGEVEFDSQEAYKESLGVDTVNVDPSYGANNGTRERNESDGGNEENTDDGLVWSVISDNYGDDFGGSDLGNNDGGGNEDSSGGDDGDDTEDGEAEDGSETNRRTGRVPPDRAGPGGF